MEISHFLFTDDTFVFCGVDQKQLEHLGWTFTWFEVISNLKINIENNELIPLREEANVEACFGVGLKGQEANHHTFGPPFKTSPQIREGVGSDKRRNFKGNSHYRSGNTFQKKEDLPCSRAHRQIYLFTYIDQEHIMKSNYLFHVSFCYSLKGKQETRMNSKGFHVKQWNSQEKSFIWLTDPLFIQTSRGVILALGICKLLSFDWKMILEIGH